VTAGNASSAKGDADTQSPNCFGNQEWFQVRHRSRYAIASWISNFKSQSPAIHPGGPSRFKPRVRPGLSTHPATHRTSRQTPRLNGIAAHRTFAPVGVKRCDPPPNRGS
jgi:hypothetical protein